MLRHVDIVRPEILAVDAFYGKGRRRVDPERLFCSLVLRVESCFFNVNIGTSFITLSPATRFEDSAKWGVWNPAAI